jgi:hypothetical protein
LTNFYDDTTLEARTAGNREFFRQMDAVRAGTSAGKAHVASARSDALTAFLATARTKAERRTALEAFMNAQRSGEEVRFTNWLAGFGDTQAHARAYEDRAMGTAATSTGGALVPTRFYGDVVRQMKEYSGLLDAFEVWTSEDPFGGPVNRPIAAAFGSGSSQTENTAFTYGPEPTLTQQAWPEAPNYAADYRVSNQLVQDAFRYAGMAEAWDPARGASAPVFTPNPAAELDALISSALGESLGRAIAPVAQAAVYATINGVGAASGAGGYLALTAAAPVTFASGATTELAANTISLDTAALMIEALDEAYLESARWHFSRTQWGGIIRQVSTTDKKVQFDPSAASRSLFGFPVVLTSQASAAAASTVAGPMLGDLGAAMTLRIAGGSFHMLRSFEKYAEFAEVYYRANLRADVAKRDPRAVVGVKYAAS